MDFELSEEERMIRDAVIEFGKKEFPPELVRELDEKEEFPKGILDRMGRVGWFGLTLPSEYGGTEGTIIEGVLLIENISRFFAPAGYAFVLHFMHSHLIKVHGSPQQKALLLPKMARGELLISIAMTEPSGGTDALSMSSFAEKRREGFILKGHKTWISFADMSEYLMTVMRTDLSPKKKTRGITLFLVEKANPNVELNLIRKLGYRACHCFEVFYDNVEVPTSSIIGEIDQGFYHLLDSLNVERLTGAAMALGVGEAAFQASVRYAKERTAFHRPIGQFQHIQRYLSDMAINLEQARLLLHKAAWLHAKGKPAELECNMADFACSEASVQTASDAMRIFASLGFSMESDVQRYFRDSRLGLFSPVSNEMIRNFICERLKLPRSY